MNVSAEKLLLSSNESKEICILGVSCFGTGSGEQSLAVGKLYNYSSFDGDEVPSILFFQTAEELIYALPKLKKSSAVGIVIASRVLPSSATEALISLALPFLIAERCETISELCCGSIAILDAKHGVLSINPDLNTIKSYSLSSRAEIKKKHSGLHGNERIYISKNQKNDSFLLAPQGNYSSEDLFGILQSLAESRLGRQLTVSLKIPQQGSNEESFCDNVESVFLAALYGNISILFDGYHGEADIDRALSLVKCSFCRLEGNRREFNGCVKKGLLISAPLWLTRELPMPHPDIICIELDTLASRALGCDGEISPHELELLRDVLRNFVNHHSSLSIAATLSSNADASLRKNAPSLCDSVGIKETFFNNKIL